MKIALIINSKAKQTEPESLRVLYDSLHAAGLDFIEFLENDQTTMTEFAEAAVKDSFDIVIAAGGDGTISAVATKLVGTKSALGIIPMGTRNNFAKDLNIPLDVNQAVRNLIDGVEKQIDVGEVNGHHFINNSSIGLYPHLVMRRERSEARGLHRALATGLAALKIFQRFPYHQVKLYLNGKEVSKDTPLLFIGNGRYDYDGLDIGARPAPITGQLSLVLLKDVSRMKLAKLSIKALFNKIHNDPDFESHLTDQVIIELPKKLIYVSKDGEVVKMESPLRYKIKPKALKVIIPK